MALTDKMRRKMGGVVVDAARAVQYTNAGTFEFLMDSGGRFYFMEVNTRLQVEHPVTEMVTGVDIVKEQIRIAAGERLSVKQSEITFTGHAIECRVNAEDPDTFRPSPGVIHAFSVPGGPGVRIDTCAHTECTISPYYDSLVAKVIVHGRDRQEAIARMRRTLEMTVIEGISTSIPLHLRVLADADFQAGRLSTAFMDRYLATGIAGRPAEGRRVIPAGAHGHRGCGRRRPRAAGRCRTRRARCLDGGARFLQLRAKRVPSGAFLEWCDAVVAAAVPYGAAVIVNDRADIARMAGASGVHVGQDDLPASAARVLLGASAIVGLSTHTREQVEARTGRADHVPGRRADIRQPHEGHGLRGRGTGPRAVRRSRDRWSRARGCDRRHHARSRTAGAWPRARRASPSSETCSPPAIPKYARASSSHALATLAPIYNPGFAEPARASHAGRAAPAPPPEGEWTRIC